MRRWRAAHGLSLLVSEGNAIADAELFLRFESCPHRRANDPLPFGPASELRSTFVLYSSDNLLPITFSLNFHTLQNCFSNYSNSACRFQLQICIQNFPFTTFITIVDEPSGSIRIIISHRIENIDQERKLTTSCMLIVICFDYKLEITDSWKNFFISDWMTLIKI